MHELLTRARSPACPPAAVHERWPGTEPGAWHHRRGRHAAAHCAVFSVHRRAADAASGAGGLA
eukprot:366523-Chlamydomonas_euryale.AAC.9